MPILIFQTPGLFPNFVFPLLFCKDGCPIHHIAYIIIQTKHVRYPDNVECLFVFKWKPMANMRAVMGDCSLGLITNEENHAEIDKKTKDFFCK